MDHKGFFTTVLGIDDPEIVAVMNAAAHEEHYPRGHCLISMGEVRPSIHLLREGVLRAYVVDENGRDVTDCFIYQTGDVVIGCGELHKPSLVAIEAITPCRVLTLPMDLMLTLMDEPQLLHIYNQQLNAALLRHWELKMLLYRCSAMERYQWFRKRYPDLEHLICGKHLASYLGITPVTLSRLRRQLKDEGDN